MERRHRNAVWILVGVSLAYGSVVKWFFAPRPEWAQIGGGLIIGCAAVEIIMAWRRRRGRPQHK